MSNTDNTQIWPEWDIELREFAMWLLSGCITCLVMPPLLAYLALFITAFVGILKTEPKAAKLFSERRTLEQRRRMGMLGRKEKKRLEKLLNDLERTEKKRDLRIYWISLVVFILTLFCILLKMCSLPPSRWLF